MVGRVPSAMEGALTGSPRAATYVISRLKAEGLEPCVAFEMQVVDQDKSRAELMQAMQSRSRFVSDADHAPLVFIGYASAKMICCDLKGKIVVVLSGGPQPPGR